MSVETLILRMSSDSEASSAPESPAVESTPESAPFLAEEAYPLVLEALVSTGLGEQICLSEDNIGEISRVASKALFTPGSVFTQFLVVPRVECAISVLLWRLRVSSTCAEGHSALDLPSIPAHVLASSLSGLLDNTKLYKVPLAAFACHSHSGVHLAFSTRPALLQTPMTPPDSVAGDSTPVPNGLPTHKKSIKFRPPPIITRTTPGRNPKSAGTGPLALNFAAAALAEYQIEPLDYQPTHDTESPADKLPPPSPSKIPPPSPSKLAYLTSPTKSGRSRSRPPSPNPPRPASPTKRLKKPPPGVKRSKSLTGKSKKPKDKDKEKEKEKEKEKDTTDGRPNSSMWTPAGVEAHYRNDSSVRTLALGALTAGSRLRAGSFQSGVPTPSASVMATPILTGAIITPFEPEPEPESEPEVKPALEAHIEVEAPTPCASPKPSVKLSVLSVEDVCSFTERSEEDTVEALAPSTSRQNLGVSPSREHLVPSGSRDHLSPSRSRENISLSNYSQEELGTPSLSIGTKSKPNTPMASPTSNSVPLPTQTSIHILGPTHALAHPFRLSRLELACASLPRFVTFAGVESILRNSLSGSPAPRNELLKRATSPSGSTRSRTISISGASLVRSRTLSGASLVRNRTVSSGESVRHRTLSSSESIRVERTRTTSDLGRTSEEGSLHSVQRASIESAQRAKLESPVRTNLESARRRASIGRGNSLDRRVGREDRYQLSVRVEDRHQASHEDKNRMSVDMDGITIMAVSIADATPVTPTPRRTAFNLDADDFLTPVKRAGSPGAMSLGTGTPGTISTPGAIRTPLGANTPGAMSIGTGTPNAHLGVSPGPSFHLSPGAMSISTVPSLSPFPESDDGDFGFRDGEEEKTVTARMPPRAESPTRRANQSPSRRDSQSLTRRNNPSPTRRDNQSPVRRPETPPKPKRRPLPPPPQGSPTRNVPLYVPWRPIRPYATGHWTDSPSRASTSTHQAIGVPMTQVSSRPRTLSTQTRGQQVESGVSESEPESLAFPGSTSTLSLPGDVSLSEVSPFTAPKELESSSESERPSPWIGPGVTSSPWVNPRASSSSSGSPWMGTNSIELLGGSGMLMNSSLPKLTESPSPRNSAETTRPKGGKHSRNGSNLGHSRAGSTVGHERNGSATGHERNGPVVGHERNGSSSRPGSSVGHSRPGSTMTHSRTGSYTHPGLGLRTGQDILVPMISPSKAISRSDVMRLVGRGDSFDSSREEPTSPRPSALSTVAEYNQPKPIFMVPGADPAKVSSTSRPKSMAHVEEEQSLHGRVASEDSEESVILNQDGQAMVRTTEVGVGAGRARVQTGVGIGVSRSRGGSVIKSKTDSGLRKRVDSGKSEPRARADSTKSNESRPRVSNVPRPKIENVRRKPVSSGSQSPVTGSPATPTSASTTSARRFLVRKASSEAPSRTRKTSNASMRKSSTSSLRSTPPTTVSSPSARKSTRTTSFSSGASTPRSNGALSPRMRTASGSGNATPKAGTLGQSNTSPPKAAPSTATPKAAPRPLPPRPGPPPVRPQRSALRPNLRASVTIPPAPVPSSSATTTPTSSGPPRTRAVTMDVQPTSPTHADPRPRRTTSISSKPPPVSRSGMSSAPTAPTPIVSRPMNRTSVHSGLEHPSNDVPFPSPESKHSLQVPEPQPLKRSLSVSSAARKLVGRTRSGSPVPPTPPVETASIAQSTDASSIEKSPQKGTRSLSRLAFSALLPKRGSNNAAAEAKAALAQAKAREVAEAKARAKAAVEDAKARAKAEAEDAKAARAVKSKEEKEAKKSSKRFGSISRRGGQS
ncbi:hypothetical protein RHS01_04984 [Rhizoctonia solani]|uniref:Uncharacterized protein n=1 Tax=Rhizoctonia solani TaxID=456999 RepID=A0A8H7M7G1_9AGAM|nr:hypothetical protein RHS01_04984 [Rhizoctonia solani]